MAGQLTGNVGCILPALDLNEAEVGDPTLSGIILLPHGPFAHARPAQPFSLLSAAPSPWLPSPLLGTLESGPTFLPPRPAAHLSPSVSHCSTAPCTQPPRAQCAQVPERSSCYWYLLGHLVDPGGGAVAEVRAPGVPEPQGW